MDFVCLCVGWFFVLDWVFFYPMLVLNACTSLILPPPPYYNAEEYTCYIYIRKQMFYVHRQLFTWIIVCVVVFLFFFFFFFHPLLAFNACTSLILPSFLL